MIWVVRARTRCGIQRPDLAWHCTIPTGSVRVGLGGRVRDVACLLAAQGTGSMRPLVLNTGMALAGVALLSARVVTSQPTSLPTHALSLPYVESLASRARHGSAQDTCDHACRVRPCGRCMASGPDGCSLVCIWRWRVETIASNSRAYRRRVGIL